MNTNILLSKKISVLYLVVSVTITVFNKDTLPILKLNGAVPFFKNKVENHCHIVQKILCYSLKNPYCYGTLAHLLGVG